MNCVEYKCSKFLQNELENILDLKDSTILLTGPTGFLGSHLANMLQKTAKRLIILKRKNSNISRIKNIVSSPNVVIKDIEDGLGNVFDGNKIDAIVHCAVEYGRGDPSCLNIISTNLVFPISVVECAVLHGVGVFINTDSYFNKPQSSYKHLLNYSLSKKSFLLWLEYFSQKIRTVNITLEHIYGENDNTDKFVENAIRAIAIEKNSTYEATNGEQKRDFIYVSDVVNAYESIIKKSLGSQTRYSSYNLGTGKTASIREFLELVKEVSQSQTQILFGAKKYREDEIMLSVADNTSLLDIGWLPNVSMRTGLKKIIDYYRES
jgi:nucleoside-diphosphate-sugar epimerase